MKTTIRWCSLWLLLMAMSGCGGGGDTGTTADDVGNWDQLVWDQDNWS